MAPQPSYLSYIDSLRAVAVLAVLFYHLNTRFVPGGFVGVDIFFVISGFIVSRSFSAVREMSFVDFVIHFYSRRLTRIVPALTVCLLVSTLATVLFIPYAYLSGTSQRTGLAAFFGFSNFVLAATTGDYFSPRAEFNTFAHTWSLGVEEQYYLLFPFLFIVWLRGYRWLSGALLAILLAASFGLSIPAASTHQDRAFYLIYYRFWELAVGALLFQFAKDRTFVIPARTGVVLSFIALVIALVTASPGSTPFPGAILPVLGTLGLILSFRALPPSSRLVPLTTHPALLYIGRISYSLYLWHWPVVVLFRWTVGLESVLMAALALALSVAAAATSYAWVEGPPRRTLAGSRLPRIAMVGTWAAVAVAGWALSSGIWSLRETISFSVVNRHAAAWYGTGSIETRADCRIGTTSYPVTNGSALSITRSGCSLPVSLSQRVFVIGDSHAFAYLPMFNQVVMDTGGRIDILTSGGCGILSLIEPVLPFCQAFHESAIASVLATLTPGDIVFLPALRIPRIVDQFAAFDEGSVLRRVADTTTMTLRLQQTRAFEGLLSTLTDRGAIVVLEAPLPVFRSPAFRCVDWFNRVNPICAGGLTIPRAVIDTLRAPVMTIFDRLRADQPKLYVWDPLPILCPTSTCDAMRDGQPMFFDGDHLSGFGNTLLTAPFERFLTSDIAPTAR